MSTRTPLSFLRGDGPVRGIVVVGADLLVVLIEQLALLLGLHLLLLRGEDWEWRVVRIRNRGLPLACLASSCQLVDPGALGSRRELTPTRLSRVRRAYHDASFGAPDRRSFHVSPPLSRVVAVSRCRSRRGE
jgi:hypothetical protein